MDGSFAAGLMKGVAATFDNFVRDKERRDRLNEAYTQRLMSNIDVVSAISDKNKQDMNKMLEDVISESAEDYRNTSKKLFGRGHDTDYMLRMQKRVRELNQKFAYIKKNEDMMARDYQVFSKDGGQTFDPDIFNDGLMEFGQTGVYRPALKRKAVDMETIKKAAHTNPPVNVQKVTGDKTEDGYYEEKLTWPGVTPEVAQAKLGAMFQQDEGIRRGMVRDMLSNGDPGEYKDYYYVPPNNPAAWNKYQSELAIAGAKREIPGSGNLTSMELDPQWQQAALQYHMKHTAPELYKDVVIGRKKEEEGHLTDLERVNLQAKRQAEHDARMAARESNKKDVPGYSIVEEDTLPDGTEGKALNFKEDKRPTVSINNDNLETLDGPKVPKGTTWNYKVAKIANGYAYVEGENPVIVDDPELGMVPSKTEKTMYYGKVPINALESQLKMKSGVKWGDIQQVTGTQKAKTTAAPSAVPSFASGPKAAAKVRYRTDTGDVYEIPMDKEEAFLKRFPKSKKI